MSLLEAREVTKEYGPVVALRSANLSIEAGEVHALLGANGAGKSTFVKILTGVIEPDGGSVELRFYLVREYEGEVENRIFRDVQWARRRDLPSYDFLEADLGLVKDLARGKLI